MACVLDCVRFQKMTQKMDDKTELKNSSSFFFGVSSISRSSSLSSGRVNTGCFRCGSIGYVYYLAGLVSLAIHSPPNQIPAQQHKLNLKNEGRHKLVRNHGGALKVFHLFSLLKVLHLFSLHNKNLVSAQLYIHVTSPNLYPPQYTLLDKNTEKEEKGKKAQSHD